MSNGAVDLYLPNSGQRWAPIFIISSITDKTSISGIKSSGKVAYFLAIFPYVVMLILLVRACTLEGAGDGMLYFVKPQWDKIFEAKVWYAAVTQVFFSLTVCFGNVIMYSSYNRFSSNVYRCCNRYNKRFHNH